MLFYGYGDFRVVHSRNKLYNIYYHLPYFGDYLFTDHFINIKKK